MSDPNLKEEIIKIAKQYGVSAIRDTENCKKNNGASAGREIFLGEFEDPQIELAAFFHELGHALSNELVLKRGRVMSKISGEGVAWEIGFGMAFEHGYEWDYDSHVMKWAREQLRSYIGGEYDDTLDRKSKTQPCPICDTPLVTPKEYFPVLKTLIERLNKHGKLAIKAHEFNKSEDNPWTTEWPTEEGPYWFYGYRYRDISGAEPELFLVDSVKFGDTFRMAYHGDPLENEAISKFSAVFAYFKKADLPCPPVQK